MKFIFCDDEVIISQQLKEYVTEYFKEEHLKMPEMLLFDSGESFLKYADNGDFDIVFLDVEMPDCDGIYVSEQLKKKNPNVIIFIVTSYLKYLDDAMKFNVFRYLTKPVDKKRLFQNLKDALYQYHTSVRKIAVETKEAVHMLCESRIVCVEAKNRRVIVHTENQDYAALKNMTHWEKNLSKGVFFRTHKSFIVNMKFVQEFDNSTVLLDKLEGKAYLTRRKYKQFKDAYLLYLESMR